MSNAGRFFAVISPIGVAAGLILFAPGVFAQVSAREDGGPELQKYFSNR